MLILVLKDRRHRAGERAGAVERDYQDGVARGVAKTPTVFVAGKPFIETFTLEEISKAIEQAIRQAN